MIDEDSPILDFYPEDFDIDMNGKKMAWQGVALLPFIDQTRLLDALRSKEDHLTDDEKRRNTWGDNIMFISEGHALYDPFCQLYTLKAVTKVGPRSFGSMVDGRDVFLSRPDRADVLSLSPWTCVCHKVPTARCSPTRHAFPTARSTRHWPALTNVRISRTTPRCPSDTTSLGNRTSTARSFSGDSVRLHRG
jgi:5'-3' exoribonuclease 2